MRVLWSDSTLHAMQIYCHFFYQKLPWTAVALGAQLQTAVRSATFASLIVETKEMPRRTTAAGASTIQMLCPWSVPAARSSSALCARPMPTPARRAPRTDRSWCSETSRQQVALTPSSKWTICSSTTIGSAVISSLVRCAGCRSSVTPDVLR